MANEPLLPALAPEEKALLLSMWKVPQQGSWQANLNGGKSKLELLEKAIKEIQDGTPADFSVTEKLTFIELLEGQSKVLLEAGKPETVLLLTKLINHIDPEVEIISPLQR